MKRKMKTASAKAPRALLDFYLKPADEEIKLPCEVREFGGMSAACPAIGEGKLADGRSFYVRCRHGGVSVRIGVWEDVTNEHLYLGGFDLENQLAGWITDAELIRRSSELLRFPVEFRLKAGLEARDVALVRNALADGASPTALIAGLGEPLRYAREGLRKCSREFAKNSRRYDALVKGDTKRFRMSEVMKYCSADAANMFPDVFEKLTSRGAKRKVWAMPKARRALFKILRTRTRGFIRYWRKERTSLMAIIKLIQGRIGSGSSEH